MLGWRIGMRLALVVVAVGLWVAASWPAVAHAQTTSVRQSKLVTTDANGNPLLNDIAVATSASGSSTRSFDTTAFASAVLTIQPTAGGSACGMDVLISPTVEIPGIYGWVRLDYAWTSGTGVLAISLASSPAQGGTFLTMFLPLAINYFRSVPSGCVFDVSLILVPFTSSVVTNGATNEGKTVTTVALAPNIIGGIDPALLGDERATIRTVGVSASHAMLVEVDSLPTGAYTSISPNDITTVETAATMTTVLRATLQNNGTAMALCLLTTNASAAVDTDTYSFSLAAASAVNNGSGSTWTAPAVPSATTYVRCIGSGGTARVSGFTHP